MKFIALHTPTDEAVYLNAEAVSCVHAVFANENRAPGTNAVVIYGDNRIIGVKEQVADVLQLLAG